MSLNSYYVCSYDNAELIDIYDPSYDGDEFLINPINYDQLSREEKYIIESRKEYLITILGKLSQEKKEMFMDIIQNQECEILICPICKKVYDSRTILEYQDLTHSSNNQLPVRKPRRHGIVSDDTESITAATESRMDKIVAARQVFLPNNKDELEGVRLSVEGRPITDKTSNTLYHKNQQNKSIQNVKHARQHLQNLIQKYGKENISISLQFPD